MNNIRNYTLLNGGTMRNFFTSIMIFALIFTFSACTKKEKNKVVQEPIVLRLAETHPKDYPTTRGDQKFADLVEERTNGRIRIEVYHSSQLGQEKEAIEQVQFGGIDFTRISVSPLTGFAPQFNVLQMPYIFRDSAHEWAVLNGEIGEKLLNSLESAGFVGLCWYDSGSRNFYNTEREIKTPADLKGLKIRVQQSEMTVNMISLLGAIATPMAFGEVYSGLQTGVIEGAENNWPSYESTKHYEVAKYITIDEHTRVPEITIASKIVMDKLSKEDQQIIKQAAKDSMAYQIAEWAKEDLKAEEKVKEAGCIITRLDDKIEFQRAMQPIYDKQPAENQALIIQIRNTK